MNVPPRSSSRPERPAARAVHEPPRLGGDLGEVPPVGVDDDGDQQRVVDRNRDPDVDARVALDAPVDVRRVESRKLAQNECGGLHDEVVERGRGCDSLRAPRRSATISDTSASAETVKVGISAADCAMRRAMVTCVGVSSTMVTSPRASPTGRTGTVATAR